MKKLWGIVVSDGVEPEIARKIKKALRPYHDVRQPEKCLLCQVKTTWTINREPVCPRCAVAYKFLSDRYLLDPCEVCGQQGEWATLGESLHSLCYSHRDAWFEWKNPELDFIDPIKQPERWHKVWQKGWDAFIAFVKEEVKPG